MQIWEGFFLKKSKVIRGVTGYRLRVTGYGKEKADKRKKRAGNYIALKLPRKGSLARFLIPIYR